MKALLKKTIFLLLLVPFWAFADQSKKHPFVNSGKITEIFLFLVLVLVLIVVLAYLAKKFRLTNKFTASGLKITSSIPLTTKDKLLVVKTKKENILLGLSPGRISYLCHLDNSELDYDEDIEKP